MCVCQQPHFQCHHYCSNGIVCVYVAILKRQNWLALHDSTRALMLQLQDEDKSSDADSEDQDNKKSKDDKQRSSDEQDEHEGEKGEKGPRDSCYEFSLTEATMLEVVMDSMRTCGLALALQALSTVLLGMLRPNPGSVAAHAPTSHACSAHTKMGHTACSLLSFLLTKQKCKKALLYCNCICMYAWAG